MRPVVDMSLLNSVVPISGYEMPEKIKKFHACNNVSRFQYDRPFHRGTKAKDNEFKVSVKPWNTLVLSCLRGQALKVVENI